MRARRAADRDEAPAAALLALRALARARTASTCVSTHSSTDSWLAALAPARWHGACRSCARGTSRRRCRAIALTRWLYTARRARIVTTGEALKRELVERHRRAGRAHRVGADRHRPRALSARATGSGARERSGLPPAGMLVGIVATLRSWKGHRYLLEALPMPRRDAASIVGDGPQREALERRSRQLGIARRVRFAGNQRDVVPWLQALDVFALPSYANEGVPQALMQAMLAGLPCVTTARRQHRRARDRRRDRARRAAAGCPRRCARARAADGRRGIARKAWRRGAQALRRTLCPTSACSIAWKRSTATRRAPTWSGRSSARPRPRARCRMSSSTASSSRLLPCGAKSALPRRRGAFAHRREIISGEALAVYPGRAGERLGQRHATSRWCRRLPRG